MCAFAQRAGTKKSHRKQNLAMAFIDPYDLFVRVQDRLNPGHRIIDMKSGQIV